MANVKTVDENAASALDGTELIRGVQAGGMVKIIVSQILTYIAAATATLTGKRLTPRVTTITSHAAPTINTDNCDAVTITALAEAITSMTTNLSGTPANFDMLFFRIKDDGTARAIAWGASFASRGATLPTTTVLGKVLYVLFAWNSVASTWDCISTTSET